MLILERLPSSSSSISTTALSNDSQATFVESERSSSVPKIKTKIGTSGGHPAQQHAEKRGKARDIDETEGGSNGIKTSGEPGVFNSNGTKTAKWTTNITLDFPDVYL
jgi:hypothetical protein